MASTNREKQRKRLPIAPARVMIWIIPGGVPGCVEDDMAKSPPELLVCSAPVQLCASTMTIQQRETASRDVGTPVSREAVASCQVGIRYIVRFTSCYRPNVEPVVGKEGCHGSGDVAWPASESPRSLVVEG